MQLYLHDWVDENIKWDKDLGAFLKLSGIPDIKIMSMVGITPDANVNSIKHINGETKEKESKKFYF